jgi:hypothetical protein
MALYLIRYKMDAERITARDCWCRDCQFIDACSGTVNVFFPSLAGITDDHLDFERTKLGRDRSEHPAMRNSRRHRSKAQDAELGATKLIASLQSFSIGRANQRPFERGSDFSLAASVRLIAT